MYIIPFQHTISLEASLKTYFHRRTNMKISTDKDMRGCPGWVVQFARASSHAPKLC